MPMTMMMLCSQRRGVVAGPQDGRGDLLPNYFATARRNDDLLSVVELSLAKLDIVTSSSSGLVSWASV
jgi:hypothetical protein